MNKKEAIQAMLDGDIVYNKFWAVGTTFRISINGDIMTSGDVAGSLYDSPFDEWEIYKEPVKVERNKYIGKVAIFKGEDRQTTILQYNGGSYMLYELAGHYTEKQLKDCFYIEGEDF